MPRTKEQQEDAPRTDGFFTTRVKTRQFQEFTDRYAVKEQPANEKDVRGITQKSVELLADVIQHPPPSNKEHALAAVPLIRHWLFAPSSCRLSYRDFSVRTLRNGEEIVQRICVGDRHAARGKGYGILKAQHQRLLFAVQDLWQEQGGKLVRVDGKRSAIVSASSRALESRLFHSHGGRQQSTIRSLVQETASIPVRITNYIDSDGDVSNLDITGLILGATFSQPRRGGQSGVPWVELYLSPVITEAFAANAIRPVNLRVMNRFDSDLSVLLYPKIDYYLASHPETELRLDGLVDKIGLSGKQFRQPRYRLRKFEPVVDELNGSELSARGCVVDARLVPTSDGIDHKIAARRRRAKKAARHLEQR